MSEELALDTRAQADATPSKAVRRWLLEIKLTQKREKEFREKGKAIIEKYRGKASKRNSFNILWANTETLRPALYNSPPKPDVRRRFRQNDMLGKAVSEVCERSLSYCVDAYDLDNCLKNDVLDGLLPGRGLSRVRYIPVIEQVDEEVEQTGADVAVVDAGEPAITQREEVEYEQALCDHVQWDDFLHGPGKVWEEVGWVGFRHRLKRDDLIEKFGTKIGKKITLNDVGEDEVNAKNNTDLQEVFKRAELWEIWDKDGGKVFYVCETYREGLIYTSEQPAGEPPLKMKGFFPIPRPLQLLEDTGSLTPIALYDLYKEQAEELDRISTRINKVVNALKVRGVYDSTLSELSELMKGDDNMLVPASQARAWMTNGGLEKAIWWMPVEKSAMVLKELYVARDLTKQVIYEITGISDIIRGVTNPNETLGAQQLKANSSSLRLQRMQHEVQRYVRDLIRLLAEVIGENFSETTLAQMTGLQFPTNQQKQVMQLQLQTLQAQPPAQPGQEDPKLKSIQNALSMPSWEDIMAVLRSDIQREYRVDVETDSTVAQSLQQDMEGLREVISGIVEFWQGAGPAVQAGAVSMDAVKQITMAIARRARLGLEVEDALESGMQEPKPQAGQQDHSLEVEQMKQAGEDKRAQAEDVREQQKLAAERERDAQTTAAEQNRHAAELASKERSEAAAAAIDQDTELKKTALQVAGQIEVAKINAGVKAAADAANAQNEQARVAQEGQQQSAERETAANEGADTRRIMDELLKTQGKLLETIAKPQPDRELVTEGGRKILRSVAA